MVGRLCAVLGVWLESRGATLSQVCRLGCIHLWAGAPFSDSHKGAICLPNHRRGEPHGPGVPSPHLHKGCCSVPILHQAPLC